MNVSYKYVLSIFQQSKVTIFESLRSSCPIWFWFFLTKIYDYYFKSKKKFSDSTDLKSRWLKPVLLYHSSNINFLHIYIQYIKVKMAVCESLTGMNFHGAQQLGQVEAQIREQMSGPDLHVFTLKFLALKKTGFSPINNTFQHFFDFCLPLFYATFQCGP